MWKMYSFIRRPLYHSISHSLQFSRHAALCTDVPRKTHSSFYVNGDDENPKSAYAATLDAFACYFAMSLSIIYLMSLKYQAIGRTLNESEVLPLIFFVQINKDCYFGKYICVK